ncbi:diguanylate cyclase [Devosia soli]|uniref:diguanylate cyclase n=1 Tax=Devosia soli TaxID=361041 RepID=A0A0F5LFE8_9HYPH|nr:diguanylate cyclase [Devosia soli]KKB80939.1 diguanylate cyclase [Devosia soli]
MKISTITNWAYAITVGLTLLSGGAFILATQYADRERDAVETAWRLDAAVEALERGAEETTEAARLYVMKGEAQFLAAFRADVGAERTREAAVRALGEAGLPPAEISALHALEADAEMLDAIEEQAVADFENGAADVARAAVFSPQHEAAQADLLAAVGHFADLVATRTQDQLDAARAAADLWGTIAKSLLALTALVFLSVLYFVLMRRVARPLHQMSGIVRRLAHQDYDVQLVRDGRRDEIGDMNEAIQIFRDNGLERARLDAERRKDQETKDRILQLMHRLQACRQESELAPIVSLFAAQLFPALSGHLFIMNDGRTALTARSTWGAPSASRQEFASLECWGIRRGKAHFSDRSDADVRCQHLSTNAAEAGLCVPLAARGDTVGMLYFEAPGEGTALAEARVYIELIAENLALAIANLQLRDRLANLAIRDPLTGLLNRRSLDENLLRVRREETDLPAALMMIDIDHFKRFNDEFGHDAGDHVMTQVAAIMTDAAKTSGIVHRYGGEEFAVVLKGAEKHIALDMAEAIRHAVETTPVTYQGQPLGTVTVSIGLASTEDSQSAATLMQRADAALLRAKSGGRNATVTDWLPAPQTRIA